MPEIKQAVILAAGEARRLRPFTVNKPKAMLPVAGKPIIQCIIEALAQGGIQDIICVTGYQQAQITSHLGDGRRFGVEIRYAAQHKQLGTGHALLQAEEATGSEFLVINGNKIFGSELIAAIINEQPPILLTRKAADPRGYGIVTSANGRLTGIVEKPAQPPGNTINGGIYAFNRDIFNYVRDVLDIPSALTAMLADGREIRVIEATGTLMDVVYPWDLLTMNDTVLQKIAASYNGTIEDGVALKGRVTIGKNSIIRQNTYIAGPVVIGEGCDIGPNVCLFPATSVGSNVTIAPFTEIRNSIVGDDVHIGSGAIIQDSMIDRGCMIGAHFCACSSETEVRVDNEHHIIKIGATLGEGCKLADSITVKPGTIIGNQSRVESLKLLSGVIPDKSLVV